MSLAELRVAMETVREGLSGDDVNIFFGAAVKPRLGEEMRVSIIASVDYHMMQAALLSEAEAEKAAAEAAALVAAEEEEPLVEELEDEELPAVAEDEPESDMEGEPLLEPEEVAEAFTRLEDSGKVRLFGVSNYRTMTLQLLQKYLKQPLQANQLQFSLAHAGMLRAQAQSNTLADGAADLDGQVLDYCRLEDITIQTWSPFQYGMFGGVFLDSPLYPELNQVLEELSEVYGVDKTALAAAWILRHPAGMQVIAGTTNPDRLASVCKGAELELRREDWYRLYKAAGNHLP
jgi:diketogulonate reductase-like aldo/keto reductase